MSASPHAGGPTRRDTSAGRGSRGCAARPRGGCRRRPGFGTRSEGARSRAGCGDHGQMLGGRPSGRRPGAERRRPEGPDRRRRWLGRTCSSLTVPRSPRCRSRRHARRCEGRPRSRSPPRRRAGEVVSRSRREAGSPRPGRSASPRDSRAGAAARRRGGSSARIPRAGLPALCRASRGAPEVGRAAARAARRSPSCRFHLPGH